ncbi:flavin reductase family protein [Bacillus swezeyi]|uniref:flavin reductase family protein n=1 Tax=Bacillus swezeyi TaxID=1925020 RepID=UPI00123898EB|nr:flavin reductase family protein [Bacillus swezeyi]KAA6474253.1 flavin reductase family protein [Bacillus swezeyi]
MFTLFPRNLTVKETYKLMSGAVVPRPIAFVTTASTVNGVVNAAPFSFFNVISADPPLLSISVGRTQGGEMKDTARNAAESKEFVVHIVDENIAEDMNQTAAVLPAHQSELDRTGLTTIESNQVSVPGIQEARIRFECKLERHLTFQNDQAKTVNDLLIGRIVCFHLADEVYDAEKGYIRTDALRPIARLAGNDYAKWGETFTLIRPT